MNYTDYIIASSKMLRAQGISNLQYDTKGESFSRIARGFSSPFTGVNTVLFNKHKIGQSGGGYSLNMMY
jgi:hypothetical protein